MTDDGNKHVHNSGESGSSNNEPTSGKRLWFHAFQGKKSNRRTDNQNADTSTQEHEIKPCCINESTDPESTIKPEVKPDQQWSFGWFSSHTHNTSSESHIGATTVTSLHSLSVDIQAREEPKSRLHKWFQRKRSTADSTEQPSNPNVSTSLDLHDGIQLPPFNWKVFWLGSLAILGLVILIIVLYYM